MNLGQYTAEGLLKEGLSFYFGQATLNYDLLRQDILAIKPMQSVLDETSNKLDAEETLEKDKALNRLLKAAYQAQIREDKQEDTQDKQQAAQDERRGAQIPGVIAQCESDIQRNMLLIQQEQGEINSLDALRSALIPQIGVYDSTIGSIQSELRRLRNLLASTPQQIVVSSNPSGPMPPPPHSGQRVTTGSQQVAVSMSAPMPPPPVRQGNPEYGRLQGQIRDAESRLSAQRMARGLLTAQQVAYATSISTHIGRIDTLQNQNGQSKTRIIVLNSEMTHTLPQKEASRQRRLTGRVFRQSNREGIASEISQSIYQTASVKSTLTTTNQGKLDHKIRDAYGALRSTKSLISNGVKSCVYDQFFAQLDTQLPSLSLSKQEEEALRLIKRNLSDHFRTVEEAERANSTLQQSQRDLREARRLVSQREGRLETLQASNPALNREIEGLESANRTHNGFLEGNQTSRKKWGRGTTMCVVLTLVVASPLIVYGAGALSLSAVVLGLISAGASALGLGSLVGGIKTLLFNRAANRESQTIKLNTTKIGQKRTQLSSEAGEIKGLQETHIPDAKREVARLDKEVEANQGTLDTLNRQAAQYMINAKAITPTTLSNFAQSPVLASAPPKDLVAQNEAQYPDEKPPAYTA